MSGIDLLSLKQSLTKLSEDERRDVSAFLIRLGQDSDSWRQETARRLNAMDSGDKTSVDELRQQLGHG